MRKIIAAAFVSLDGVMQAPGGPTEDPTNGFKYGGWNAPYWDEVMGQFMGSMFDRPYDLLLGRKTYEIFAAHWPFMPADDPIAQSFNAVTKYVATRSDQAFDWVNTTPLRGDAAAAVRQLKSQDGPDLLTQGSSDFVQTLFADGLVDEIHLLTFPVILGPGKRFFQGHAMASGLKLVSTTTSTTGVVMSIYQRAGAVKTGSFQLAEPSAAELARQDRMLREG